MTKHQSFSAEYVVQSNLDCYNNRDIKGFMEAYHSDIMYLNYETKNIMLNGLEQVRDNYIRLFDASPNLNSTINVV